MSYCPPCGVIGCPNRADPRWYAADANNELVMICDGHDPPPRPEQVKPKPVPKPDPITDFELAEVARHDTAASYGPWREEWERGGFDHGVTRADFELCVFYRDVTPRMARELRAARAERDRLKLALEGVRGDLEALRDYNKKGGQKVSRCPTLASAGPPVIEYLDRLVKDAGLSGG